MLLKIVLRIVMSLVSITLLTGIRIYMMHGFISSRPMDAYPSHTYRYRPSYDAPKAPPLPPDHSGWLVFSSTDPATGVTTRHARLRGQSADPSMLELLEAPGPSHQILLSLPDVPVCAATTTVQASFDSHHPNQFTVHPNTGSGCILAIADYDGFLLSLRNADVLVVTAPKLNVTFAVAGLSWD